MSLAFIESVLFNWKKESFYANQISKSYLELIVPIDEMSLEVWVVGWGAPPSR